MTIHRIGPGMGLGVGLRVFVDDQLMAEEIEIHPVIAGAAFRQVEHVGVKVPGCRQVMNGDGEVKRR